jgi:hypothetical protein
MQLPALDDRDTRGALWGEAVGRWGALGAMRAQSAPLILFLHFAILFYFVNIMTFTICIVMN